MYLIFPCCGAGKKKGFDFKTEASLPSCCSVVGPEKIAPPVKMRQIIRTYKLIALSYKQQPGLMGFSPDFLLAPNEAVLNSTADE